MIVATPADFKGGKKKTFNGFATQGPALVGRAGSLE